MSKNRSRSQHVAALLKLDGKREKLESQLRALQDEMSAMADTIMGEMGDETRVSVPSGTVTLAEKSSLRMRKDLDTCELVATARAMGLTITHQPPEVVAAATVKSALGRGVDVSQLATVKITPHLVCERVS